ncbi:hypothetical protein CK203_018603 [Vitis vinifera]|uniref:Uncharacterized protein n=1 Tax=Vitis vinifera TaxID=29760 RepID=A0A438J5W0_VITVI|nr:hypothetical protein CK203_018603 [Vitis vinifera]
MANKTIGGCVRTPCPDVFCSLRRKCHPFNLMELHQFGVGSLVLTPFDERNRHHELLWRLFWPRECFIPHSVLQLDLTVFYQTTPIDESSWSKHVSHTCRRLATHDVADEEPLERFVALINQLQVHVDTHVDDLRAHIDTCVNEFYDQCQHMDECLTVVESWVSTHAVHAPSLFPKETNQARLGFHALHFGAFVMACLISWLPLPYMVLYVIFVTKRIYNGLEDSRLSLIHSKGHSGCKPVETLIEANHELGDIKEEAPVDQGSYQKIVGSSLISHKPNLILLLLRVLYCTLLRGNLVTWKSQKQSMVAMQRLNLGQWSKEFASYFGLK